MKRIFFLILVFFTCVYSHAQGIETVDSCVSSADSVGVQPTKPIIKVPVPTKVSVCLPNEINKSLVFADELYSLPNNNYGQNKSTSKYWNVFSDRNNNKTYLNPDTLNPSGIELKFAENVRIAKIENDFALIYIEKQTGAVNYPQLSYSIEGLGWIPMQNLLLWDKVPCNESGIANKVLCNENFNNSSIYDSPLVTSKQMLHENVKRPLGIFYVIKTDTIDGDVRMLLSNSMNIYGTNVSDLIGWVSADYMISWSNRVVFQENNGILEVSDDKDDDILSLDYSVRRFLSTNRNLSFGSNDALYFPLLENTKNGMVTIGFPLRRNDGTISYQPREFPVSELKNIKSLKPYLFFSAKEIANINSKNEKLYSVLKDGNNKSVTFLKETYDEYIGLKNGNAKRSKCYDILSGSCIVPYLRGTQDLTWHLEHDGADEQTTYMRDYMTKYESLLSLSRSTKKKDGIIEWNINSSRFFCVPLDMLPY